MSEKRPCDMHLVGSVPFSSSEEVFRHLCATLPDRLHRIPDDETDKRNYFVRWLGHVFQSSPFVMHPRDVANQTEKDETVKNSFKNIELNSTGHGAAALASYQAFRTLREQKMIESGTRFQVSLPSPVNVIAMLETVGKSFTPWFSPARQGIIERLSRLSEAVAPNVEVGYHLCYGDINRQHFVQPKDAGHLVSVANSISKLVQRSIQWVHMPVPKDRTDAKYFAPLEQLALHDETKLYLGLVHANDHEGTVKRIKAAQKAVYAFGVATECRMGRTPVEELDSILEISAAVTAAHPKPATGWL